MEPGISDRIIKPHNCVVAFGIPTSREGFLKDQDHPNKEFARRFNGRGWWDEYYIQIVSNFERILPVLTRLGVEVVTDSTLQKFGELFDLKKFDVIILFAHWSNSSVEFHDGFASIPDIVEKIPDDFDGIIDLCACHPEPLTIALRRERPRCLVKFVNKEVIPYQWMLLYPVLFTHLKNNDLSYLDALEAVIGEFLESAKRMRKGELRDEKIKASNRRLPAKYRTTGPS